MGSSCTASTTTRSKPPASSTGDPGDVRPCRVALPDPVPSPGSAPDQHGTYEGGPTTCAGRVELNVTGGGLPDITRRRLEQVLSDDHDLRVVLFDDGRPLAVSDLIHADQIPTKTRIAVEARDGGCRFGSNVPPGRTHIHHIDGRDAGHHPDRLICLGPWPHLRGVHRHGWTPTPRSEGAVVWRRGTRTITTLPRATPLRRVAPDDDPHADS